MKGPKTAQTLEDFPGELLTAKDLGVFGFGSRNTIYESVRRGEFPEGVIIRLGGRILFSKRGLLHWLEGSVTGGTSV